MSSIITLTFSPSVDKSSSVPELIPEKKLKCGPPKFDPGGGGINVARAITLLGGSAIAVYPAGSYTGDALNDLLATENVPAIVIRSKSETRENIVILEEKSNKQFRFGMPGSELTETEWRNCLREIEKVEDLEFIVASGSLPPGVPEDVYGQLAIIARKKKAKFVVDTSGEALKYAVKEGVYLLKPNLGELSTLVGKKHLEDDEIASVAREVIEKGGCEVIVVSMAGRGAMLVTRDEEITAIPPRVEVKSTVGAGDSMVAGIVLALSQGKSLKEALHYGVASGTAATLHPGTELCSKEDTERLFTMINSSS